MKKQSMLRGFWFALFGTISCMTLGILPIFGLALGAIMYFVKLPYALGTGPAGGDANELTEKEKKFMDAVKAEVKRLQENANLGLVRKEYVDTEITRLNSLLENSIDEAKLKSVKADMQQQFDELAIAMKAQRAVDQKAKSVIEQIHEGLTANKDNLKKLMQKDPSGVFSLNLKLVGTMTFSNSVTGIIPAAMLLPGLNDTAKRVPFIRQLITNGMTSSPKIDYVYAVTGEGGSDTTTEGNTKNQMDKDYALGTASVTKYSVYIKISEEMLEDIDWMTSEVNNTLLVDLELKTDAVILAALISAATAFSAGSFAGTIPGANVYDALTVAVNQILIANQPMPTAIVLHPTDYTKMLLTKLTTEDYLKYRGEGGAITIMGVPCVMNTGMTVDNFLVLNGQKAAVYFRNDIRIETGYDGNDFVKNLRTIIAENRFVTLVKANDATAHVKGTFTVAIAALDAGS